MARKLRKKRVAAALLILILLIGGVCFLIFRGCSRNESGENSGSTGITSGDDSNNTGSSQNSGSSAEDGSATAAQTAQALNWPLELSNYIREYTGAGEIVSASSTTDAEGKAIYKVQYKGTTIDSCFAYAKETLEIDADWTEEVTGELYTLTRERDTYTLSLRCEPKAPSGYDLQIEVKIK